MFEKRALTESVCKWFITHTCLHTGTHTHAGAYAHTHSKTANTHLHACRHIHVLTHIHTRMRSRTPTHTVQLLFKMRTATGIKEFLNLFYIQGVWNNDPREELQIPGTRRDLFHLKLNGLSQNLFFTNVQQVSLRHAGHVRTDTDTFYCKLFLFLTLRLLYQQIKGNERMLSMNDLQK